MALNFKDVHNRRRTSCVAVILYFSNVAVVLVESSDAPDIQDWFMSVNDMSISSTSRLSFKLNWPPTIGDGRPLVSLVCREIKKNYCYTSSKAPFTWKEDDPSARIIQLKWMIKSTNFKSTNWTVFYVSNSVLSYLKLF